MALEKELDLYHRKLPDLLPHEGKFVVISGDVLESFFDAYHDALKAGYEKFGMQPFLVKRIESVEKAYSFSRDIQPCHT